MEQEGTVAMPQWSDWIPADQAYVEGGLFARSVVPIPLNDVVPRCRALTRWDIQRIVALGPEGWVKSAEYVAGSRYYLANPFAALNLLLPRMPATLREITWRGTWLTEEEVAGLPYQDLIAAVTQVVAVTMREKSPRDLALAAAEELGISPELIARLTGE